MIKNSAASIEALTQLVVKQAHKDYNESNKSCFLNFIRLYYSQASVEDLLARPAQDLYGLVLSHWNLAYQRQEHQLKLALYNPTVERNGWASSHTVLQVMTSDAPFLVDSIRMEIERLGITTHLMIYMGGMSVARDQNGWITDIASYASERSDYKIESPIYFEIDSISDTGILQKLLENIQRIIADVNVVVDDWELMASSMQESISELSANAPVDFDQDEVSETEDFMKWLLDENFTFLGKRDYVVKGEGGKTSLSLVSGSGLGVLRDESTSKSNRFFSDLPEKARKQMLSSHSLLVISQTNTLSTVHRAGYTAYIGVKQFDSETELLMSERRFIGLYTSRAYSTNPWDIPFLRHKVKRVVELSGWPRRSHAGKDLAHILTVLPRDDLFQASVDELLILSKGILHLQDRRLVRFFVREDAYGRYMSCLVYFPREIFNTNLIGRIQAILVKAFKGKECSYTTHLSDSVLAHAHFMVRTDSKQEVNFCFHTIQDDIVKTAVTWQESFDFQAKSMFGNTQGERIVSTYVHTFPVGYTDEYNANEAVEDVVQIESLSDEKKLALKIVNTSIESQAVFSMKLFHCHHPVALSDALPILENMGLRVISEQSYELCFDGKACVWISDFRMVSDHSIKTTAELIKSLFYDVFEKTYYQHLDNDLLNKLVLIENMNWRDILLLRAYAKYFQQSGMMFSHQYIAEALVNNSGIAHLVKHYFHSKFSPERPDSSADIELEAIKSDILLKLESVRSLDEDRILRHFVTAIDATLRTNFFQRNENNCEKNYVAFKFNPLLLPGLPLPLPAIEIFVYSRSFEGLHLRSSNVARGGLRWSDRREDYRTEVLGLMKAQRVKNSIIVPAGAKGGFVAKNLAQCDTRDAFFAEGVRCYKLFINGLLDCVDNIVDGEVVTPEDTVCYDDKDPYLVVAADKGTATFSDTANQIAEQRQFWLSDAFASGGSAGYDHKKMGITAKGAWVSAKRSFQELGIDIDDSVISVVGIGDMAGDVFGNGMLLSDKLKLVAAFNHLHIFIDPNPDPLLSFEERKRLFELPRSSWQDYNPELISQGGGVFHRTAKSIVISNEMQALLSISDASLTPNQLLVALLSSSVDMIWNGGIGTFVKSSSQTHEEVGDRSNNAIRIDANQLRARVVCEGGNLGLTQEARIEYDRLGGKIHTDFIDNSAGVDCSDNEVNIKIMLREVMAQEDFTLKQRNQLLRKMTSEVEQLVLENNYQQNRLIGQVHYALNKKLNVLRYYMDFQEEGGFLDRALECLPTDDEILQRRLKKVTMSRPEIAVLIAYSKNILKRKMIQSSIASEPYMENYLVKSFPTILNKKFHPYVLKHRLRDHIIVTQLSNQVVSDMGVTFVYQLQYETGLPLESVIKAYIVAREVFQVQALFNEINKHDYCVDTEVLYQMTDDVIRLVRRVARWVLRNHTEIDIVLLVSKYQKPVSLLFSRLSGYILGEDKKNYDDFHQILTSEGVHVHTAHKIALCIAMYHSVNIISVVEDSSPDLSCVAKIYFHLVHRLNLIWFREYINQFQTNSQWSDMAVSAYKADLDLAQRALTLSVVQLPTALKTVSARVNAWLQKHEALFYRWESIIEDLRGSKSNDFAIISVAVREISDIARMVSGD